MAKFCRSCGAPVEEGAQQCGSCGAALNAPAAPVEQPKSNEKANEVLDKVSDVLNTSFLVVEKVLRIAAKKVVALVQNAQKKSTENGEGAEPQKETSLNVVRLAITVVMIVLCVIAIVLNVTMKYDVSVKATASYNGETRTETASGPMEELLMDADEFIPVGIVCLLWAVFNLVLIIMAAILIVKLVRLANTNRAYTSLAMTGLIGDAVYMILYKILGTGTMESWGVTMKYSIGFNSFVWIHVILFALAVAWVYVSRMLKSAPSMARNMVESAE